MKTKDNFEVKLGDTIYSVYTDTYNVSIFNFIVDEDTILWIHQFYKLKENAIKEAEEYFDSLIKTLKHRKEFLRS